MFDELRKINMRPAPFQFYTAAELWTDPHTAKQMLAYHLNETIDASSRNHEFIERSVDWICGEFGVGKTTKIADFGCGPGLYTERFAERGANVTGIDFSENSLGYARRFAEENGLEIDYVQANYLEFETDETFDLITMIMCDYCALSPEQRKRLLANFSSLLKPGGAVLLDVYSLKRFATIEEAAGYELNQLNRFWSPQDYYCFVNTFKYENEKVTLDKYTIIEESRTREVYNWLQHFSREAVAEELGESGFKVDAWYADVAGADFDPEGAEFALVARRVAASPSSE